MTHPVAGVAIGVMTREDPSNPEQLDYRLLTDLLVRGALATTSTRC